MARGSACGVREAPRHEIAEGEPARLNRRYGDLTLGPIGVGGVGWSVRAACLSAADVDAGTMLGFGLR